MKKPLKRMIRRISLSLKITAKEIHRTSPWPEAVQNRQMKM